MRKSLAFLSTLALSLTTSVSAFAATYEIGFENRPSYIPNNVVVLTFDDGPDWVNTAKVLDTLKQKNAKASFFINSENWSSLSQDQPMRDLVKRMVQEGHELANHTMHHNHLPELSAAAIETEITDVQRNVNNIFGAGAPRLTLLRAPHGEPFQDNNPSNPSAAYKKVAPIVGKYAAHIGWNIDSSDWVCTAGDGNCVYNNVVNQLKTPGQGSYGIILMHSVHEQTAEALPRLIDYIRSKGFQIWSTEDVVRARFGKSSLQLVTGTSTATPPPPSTSGSAPVVGKSYNIVSKNSGKCLDIDAGTSLGQQWACGNRQANQMWRVIDAGNNYIKLASVASNQCLDVVNKGTENATQTRQSSCDPISQRRINLKRQADGSYQVVLANSGKCLDIAGASKADGGKAQIWTCTNVPQQQWFFKL